MAKAAQAWVGYPVRHVKRNPCRFESCFFHKTHYFFNYINHFINPKAAGKGQREVKALLVMLYYSMFLEKAWCKWKARSENCSTKRYRYSLYITEELVRFRQLSQAILPNDNQNR